MQKNNSKLNSKILIISQLRSKFSEKNNSHILFLNEGCRLYKTNKEYKYELYKNISVLNYKINSIDKNFSYLLEIYESLLETLSIKLNKIHNLSYSVQSWRIIIGPGLFEFISIIFYNWKALEYINNNYSIKHVEIAKSKKVSTNFRDYKDFVCSSTTDEFNNIIYTDLLKYFKNIKIKYFFINKKKNKKIKNKFLDYIIKFLDHILLFNNLFINKKFFFHESYFNIRLKYLLGIKIGQFDSPCKSPSFKEVSLKRKFREQKLDYSYDKFLNILNNLIFKYIPVSYLENFDNYRQKIITINWPKNPKIIFSSNSFFHDDFFKTWLVEKKNSNSKFISGQHGGGFFISKFHFYELHQKKVSDKILTWGYKKESIYKPMFNFKTATKKIKFNNSGNLLMVDYELSRFSGAFSLNYNHFSSLSHLNDKFNLVKNLNSNIRDKLVFRTYVHDFGWSTVDRLKEISSSIQIDQNKNIYVSLKNIRICVVNLNSTVFLETLNLNLPTIIFFDPKQDLIRNDAKKYFDLLKKVNIYFDNSTSAAEHLNNIWNQVDKWWYNKKTQNAVNLFCENFSKRTNHPVNELLSFFKNSLK